MARKVATKSKSKLTDAERHKRFVSMAREVEADESSASFDRAFKMVAKLPTSPKKRPPRA